MLAQDDVPQETPTLDESDRCVFVCELVCVNSCCSRSRSSVHAECKVAAVAVAVAAFTPLG